MPIMGVGSSHLFRGPLVACVGRCRASSGNRKAKRGSEIEAGFQARKIPSLAADVYARQGSTDANEAQ